MKFSVSSFFGLLQWLMVALLFIHTPPVLAEGADADVIFVKAEDHGSQGWVFHVTVKHPDTGWDDYCNGWDVVTDRGTIAKINESDEFTRLLLHPHENEQPFTRSQSRLFIPEDAEFVIVRAHDLIHGFGGKEVRLSLTSDSGPDYEIIRH